MKTEHSSNWFLRGFILTFIVVLLAALAIPTLLGRAQEGGEPNNLGENVSNSSGAANQTDDPLGRAAVPLADDGDPGPNNLLVETGASTSGRTDDPQGRVLIPFADGANLPLDNTLDDTFTTGGTFDAEANEANIKREAETPNTITSDYTSPLVIPAADFAADGANPDSMFFPFGGGYFQGDAENYGCLVAPVYLPQGVTVTDMFVTTYDNDGSFNATFNLRRADNFAGGATTMASAATTGSFAGVQVVSDASIDDPLVLYPDYSYYVTTCLLSGSIRLYSVRLYYTEP